MASPKEQKEATISKIKAFIRNFCDFNLVVELLISDKNRKWEELYLAGQFFKEMMHYASHDSLAQSSLIVYAVKLYAKAFSLCPIRSKHIIAYDLHKIINNSYYTRYVPGSSVKHYNCRFVDEFGFYDTISYNRNDFPQGLLTWSYSTRSHRLGNLIQLYLLNHIYNFNKISPNTIKLDKNEDTEDMAKWVKNITNLDSKEIKKTAILLLKEIFDSVSDEEIDYYTFEVDEYWAINKNNEVIIRDIGEEIRIHEEEFNMYGYIRTDFEKYYYNDDEDYNYNDDEDEDYDDDSED